MSTPARRRLMRDFKRLANRFLGDGCVRTGYVRVPNSSYTVHVSLMPSCMYFVGVQNGPTELVHSWLEGGLCPYSMR